MDILEGDSTLDHFLLAIARVVDPDLSKMSKWDNHFTKSTYVSVLRLLILYFHSHLHVHLQTFHLFLEKKVTPIYVPFLSRKFAHQCINIWDFPKYFFTVCSPSDILYICTIL